MLLLAAETSVRHGRQLQVFGFVDHTHLAAELDQNAVMRNGFPDHTFKAVNSHGASIQRIAGLSAANRGTEGH
jgi:hypothetical protein